jgi:gamma-glutamyltranspeptidase
MTEPGSTGIGGDMFCLFYDAKTKKVHALNGSGRAPGNATCEKVRESLGLKEGDNGTIPMNSAHGVTVPGAAAGWVDVVEKFGSGKLSMEQILTPAIELGEDGFPVSEIMGYYVSFLFSLFNRSTLLIHHVVVKSRKVDPRCLAQLRRNAQEGPEWQGWLPRSKTWRDHA